MKAICINPKERTVEYVDKDWDLEALQEFCAGGGLIDATRLRGRTLMYVDDEGLLKNPKYFFSLDGNMEQMFCGNAVILDTDEDGNDLGTTLEIEKVRNALFWIEKEVAVES